VTLVLAALTRNSVASHVITLVYVYVILIFIRVIVSYLPRIPYSRPLDILLTFVRDVVDPYLNIWRRVLPMARLGPASIDLSPMIGTLALFLVGNVVANLISGG
jgi:YggT family protein